MMNKLSPDFFQSDAVSVARSLLGKFIVRMFDDGRIERFRIAETEAYAGEDDLACHASKGRTKRTEIMYADGGVLYVYLIYGMYWMLNVVTNEKDVPHAVLIRAIDSVSGPGKVGKILDIDRSFNGEDLRASPRIWFEDAPEVCVYEALPRVGIDYATEEWRNKPWRFIAKE